MKTLLVAGAFLCLASAAAAMDFRVSGDKLLATGEIVPGDAQRFVQTVAGVSIVSGFPNAPDVPEVTAVALSSPGGNLFEGIRLGQAIRAASIPTLVMSDKTCASACAIAFLGGKIQGASTSAVRRELEPGARLAFHGYKLTAEEVHVANETLDIARVVNAIILDYASRMGDVDIGTLAELLNVPPEKVEIIDTPRKIAALGITLVGQPLKPPKGWAVNACRAVIAKQLSVFDAFGAENRLGGGEPEPMTNLEAFRRRLLDDKYNPAISILRKERLAAVRDAVMKLPAGDALDLLAGEALHLEQGKVGVWRVPLERGAGFYFDACYAATDFSLAATGSQSIQTILISSVFQSMVVGYHDILAGFPGDTPLW
jgi:hypothetical protein